jgi:hypothetical protein
MPIFFQAMVKYEEDESPDWQDNLKGKYKEK